MSAWIGCTPPASPRGNQRIPSASAIAKTIHLERPALERALLDLLRRTNVPILSEKQPRHMKGGIVGEGWRAHHVVDATGRAAVTARRRIRPSRPWVSRSFWASSTACQSDATFSIAALPEGYAYRLGAASIVTLGIVGRGTAVSGSPCAIDYRLRTFAPWLLEGLPAVERMMRGVTAAASAQWTEENSGLRIGDAALARDALSSQGIATGTSEALLAAAVAGKDDIELIQARQREQRQAHLTSLLQAIDRSRYSTLPTWRNYRKFVVSHIELNALGASAALQHGRIEPIDLDQKFYSNISV